MMKMGRAAIFAVLLASASTGWSQEKVTFEEQLALAKTPEQVSSVAEVKGVDDELEPSIWISTEPFLKRKTGDDKFFRANIDKATGEIFYQVYLSSVTSQSLRLNRMTYIVGGELRTAKVQRVYFDVSCQRYGCSHYEDHVATIPREDLEALAIGAPEPFWRGRLFGQNVEGIDLLMLRNETSGLLVAVDRVISARQQTAQ